MAILTQEKSEMSGGFSKVISKSAQELLFNIVQMHQYAYPIKSTIREIVSNGLDSTKEKGIALEIIAGRPVTDFYREFTGDELQADSQWDRNYYDPEWLSNNDNINIVYYDGGDIGKDSITIEDTGVGMSAERIEKYFSIGYSTKRLNPKALGKFGIGAKSPLSVGIPFYTVRSRYNGFEYEFAVYAHDVENLIPLHEFLPDGSVQENIRRQFKEAVDKQGNPYVYNVRKTAQPNGVKITIATKKHHKQMYIDAVQSQLLYFPQVKMGVMDSEKNYTTVPVEADILFENEYIILSKNSRFSRPHMLLNNINYGPINFQELDLEEKVGNIGFKVNPDDVSVNPSRETLIWDDRTRETIHAAFDKVVAIAEDTINNELQETDFLSWMHSAAVMQSTGSWGTRHEDTVIGRLSRIVDVSKMEVSYMGDKSIKFTYSTWAGIDLKFIIWGSKKEGSKTIRSLVFSGIGWVDELASGKPLYVQKGNTNIRKHKFMASKLHPGGMIIIRCLTAWDVTQPLVEVDIPDAMVYDTFDMREKENRDRDDPEFVARFNARRSKMVKIYNLILASKVQWYEDVEVPEDFVASDSDEEVEHDVVQTVEAEMSTKERRKLQGKTILSTLRNCSDWQKVELPVSEIDKWTNPEIYWHNQDMEAEGKLAAMISDATKYNWKTRRTYAYRSQAGIDAIDEAARTKLEKEGYGEFYRINYPLMNHFRDDSPVRLIRVAQNNVKYYRDFKDISKFFREIKGKTITMSNALVKWNTARLLNGRIFELQFMKGMRYINGPRYSQWETMTNYIRDNYRPGLTTEQMNSLVPYLDRVTQFQQFVQENPDDAVNIATMAKAMFNTSEGVEITDARAIDLDIYNSYLELLSWSEPIKIMLNMVNPLIVGNILNEEQESEIRNYLSYRNCTV